MPQGTISYTGVSYPKGGVYTQTLGVHPDRVSMNCIPQGTTIPATGTVTFSYDGASITLPNCFLDDVKVVSDANDGHLLSLTLLDRRWRWHYAPPISGYYNVYRAGVQVTAKKKSLRALAELLLQQMGEATPNVSALSSSIYPEVRWDAERPAQALEQLLREHGFSVTLGFGSETVTVVQIGAGTGLTTNTFEMMISSTVDPQTRPQYCRVCYGPSKMQARIKLEAVALETDNTWVPADSVSYKPTDGWKVEHPARLPATQATKTQDETDRALKSVFRAYRIYRFTDNTGAETLALPDGSLTLGSIKQILPLENRLLDAESIRDDGNPIPFRVYGKRLVPASSSGQPAKDITTTKDDEIVGAKVYFDGENGLLIFEEPQYYVEGDEYKFAELYLECAFTVTSATTYAPIHYEKDITVDASGYGYYPLRYPEVEARTVVAYTTNQAVSSTSTNRTTLDTLASDLTNLIASQFATTASQIAIYCQPILTLRCNGVIHQVQHIISDGTRHAGSFTTVSVNQEFDRFIRSRDERAAFLKTRVGILAQRSEMLLARRKDSGDD